MSLAQALRKVADDWRTLRNEQILMEPLGKYYEEAYKKTPMSTEKRYGKGYANYPEFGTLRQNIDFQITASSNDIIQYRIKTEGINAKTGEEYSAKVIDYPITARWTTEGTGPNWFEWAWQYLEKSFTDAVNEKLENSIGSAIEESL